MSTDLNTQHDERKKLAQALSTALNSPLLPERLEREIGNFVCDTSTRLVGDWQNSPETIEEILAFGDCGYGNCPGTADGTPCPGPEAHPREAAAVVSNLLPIGPIPATESQVRELAPLLKPEDRDRLAQAVADILTIEGTPAALFNAVGTFIEEGASDTISKLWKAPLIAGLIDRVIERESEGEEVANAEN